MAYINETTTTLADFATKLEAFLSGEGWTTYLAAGSGQIAARKSGAGYDVAWAAQWSTASPNNLGLYQYLGAYNSGVAPYQQTDDSGNGAQSTTDSVLDDQRHVVITNTPVQYWAFADDYYCHVVVQSDSTRYRHFGFGQLDKWNDWTGGEYVYGSVQNIVAQATDVTIRPSTSILLDGGAADEGAATNMEEYAATVHIESLPDQAASGKYAVFMGNQGSGNLGNDRQGTPRARMHMVGGYRAGPGVPAFAQMVGTLQKGQQPLYPLLAFYWNRSTERVYPLGVMKDVRGISIKNYAEGDEITIGADTWKVFPAFRKSPDASTLSGYSGFQGIAYRKIP